jgi:diguanylate cyclase (GGDEF)-like protein
LSEKDALTSQWNRRKFDIELQSLCMRVKRYPEEEQAALCLFDIDHFKQVNDQYGHDVGDHVIKSVAQLLKGELRDTDLLARVGGEEFAVIMPNTSVEEAEAVSNRIRNVVEQHSMHNVTLSGGVSDICANPSQTYKRTDMALYDSKYLGRNRISVIKSDQVQAFV